MNTDPEQGARAVMGIVMILLAFLGTAIVGHASDLPMTVFGYALILFGTIYTFGLVRQHFDAVEAARRNTAMTTSPPAQAASPARAA